MKTRSTIFTLPALILLISIATIAQDKKLASPPAQVSGSIQGINITINYHRPSAKGRKIMGELVPFDKVWRTGANATTSIEFSSNAKIEGKAIAKGKYGLYTIPGEKEWTIIINKDVKWGHYDYNESQDVLRVKVTPVKSDTFIETFTISIDNEKVTLKWEKTSVTFNITKA